MKAVTEQLEDVPFDSREPAFCFGHGLSYTSFDYSNLKIKPEESAGGKFEVSLNLKNTGEVKGCETTQVYIQDGENNSRRYLKGFKRVTLNPGESKKVIIKLGPEDLGVYNTEYRFVVEPGKKMVFVGSSIEDIRLKGTLNITEKK